MTATEKPLDTWRQPDDIAAERTPADVARPVHLVLEADEPCAVWDNEGGHA
jgi:hypothetical protein